MSDQRLFVFGAGGHGKVVADVVLRAGMPLEGFVDDRRDPGSIEILGLPVLGNRDWLQARAGESAVVVALGIGDNRARQEIAAQCEAWSISLATVVHPRAIVAPSAQLGAGTMVMAGAVINPDARIGRGVIINTAAVVEHDVVIGDFAHLSPNAGTGGAAQMGALSHVGVGASLLPGATVGAGSIVGAGAVVVEAIPDGVVAYGVPARVQRTR